jgi:hypothetical protein
MKRITILALAVLIASTILSVGCGPYSDSTKATVEEVSAALKQCIILQHALDNPHAFDQFTVRDVEFGNETTMDLYGHKVTIWQVKAKLYDANGQYVEDLEQNLIKTDLGGWVCQ